MDYSWIQISDLHIFDNTETVALKKAFKKLAEVNKISFIVVTGDLHQYKDSYLKTIDYLETVRTSFGVDKRDLYIVPGNHDSGDCLRKKEITYYIQQHIENEPDCYLENFTKDGLVDCFSEYNSFIRDYYGIDNPYSNPEQLCVRRWNDCINIIHLNTSIICNGDNSLKQIVDIKSLYKLDESIDDNYPTIIIAHHPFSTLHTKHQEYLRRTITELRVSAYLCGDLHKEFEDRIFTHTGSGTSIPCIVCGKTAPETKDNYSDLGCIIYQKRGDEVTVIPYLWNSAKKRFESSTIMDSDQGALRFPLLRKETLTFQTEKTAGTDSNVIMNQTQNNNGTSCIWLPDAEFADGAQARFNSYTRTRLVQEFLKSNSDSRVFGLSAVRGVGKTFILQIMRSKLKKEKLKLPIGIAPTGLNNWGTEKIDIRKVSDYSGLYEFSNVVSVWEYCILAYVINQCINNLASADICTNKTKDYIAQLQKSLKTLLNSNNIEAATYHLCISKEFSDLNRVMVTVLDTHEWYLYVNHDYLSLSRLEYLLSEILKQQNKEAFLVLIDKLDQSITQTSTEMPSCDNGCDLANSIIECKKKEKEPGFCIGADCNNKCCYGCEKYMAMYSRTVSGLRIHDEGNSRHSHISVWQYIQQGLVVATYYLTDSFRGKIQVYYTVRQEAFAREDGLFGDDAKKIRATVVELWYSREEQKRIFYECIQNEENAEYLFDKHLLKNSKSYELAFVGTDKLCHPHVEGLSETVFDSIYRHSFDRARDIQEYGKVLSTKISNLKTCKDEMERGEKVKKYIEEYAAELAFSFSSGSTLNDKCYFYEKRKLLPNFWANTENFKLLLSYFKKNLLFATEARKICKAYNKKAFGIKIKCNQCNKCTLSQVSPFSMLYNMGMLGRIKINANNEDDVEQDFIHSKNVTYINNENNIEIQNNTLYVLHPALTKSIDANIHQIGHFKGFIIGKGLKIKKELLVHLCEEYKADRDAYEKKYFYVPPKS